MQDNIRPNDPLAAAPKLIRRWANLWNVAPLAEQVKCVWSPRLSRSLGRAYPETMLIKLNLLLQHPPYSLLLREVLCHEVAHLAVHALYGSTAAAHGAEWQHLLRLAGFEPRREVRVEQATAPVSKGWRYEHTCPVCQATRLANRPQHNWRCASCNQDGLAGTLIIRSIPTAQGARDA